MWSRGFRQGLVIAAVAAFALVGTVDGALAKSKHSGRKKHPIAKRVGPVVTSTQSQNPNPTSGTFSAEATCPAGTILVGGGFRVEPKNNNAPLVYSSHRGAANSWTVSATPFSVSDTVTAEAYCRAHAPSLQEVIAPGVVTGTISSVAATTVDAACPAGQKAVAGGFATGGSFDRGGAAIFESERGPSGSTWRGSFASSAAFPVTVFGYCARERLFPISATATSSTNLELFSASPSGCPTTKVKLKPRKKRGGKRRRKRKVVKTTTVSGGFLTTLPGVTPSLHEAIILESARTSTGWEATSLHAGTPPDNLTTTGYCAV
jgi:hypothetical protein